MHASSEIWSAGVIVWAISALGLRGVVSGRAATLIAGAKVAVVLAYFVVFPDASWTVIDDQTYYRNGRHLLSLGHTPVSVFTEAEAFRDLLIVSNGLQFLYNWFNLATQYLLAQEYWAPVLANVGLTALSARALMSLLEETGASPAYARAAALFFLFQWDVVAWSSFLNVKDVLVMALTAPLLLCLVRLTKRFSLGATTGVLLLSFVVFWLRFYVPLVAGLAVFLYQMRLPRRRVPMLLLAAAAAAGGMVILTRMAPDIVGAIRISLGDLAFGWVRTLVSPLPWSVQREYGFLMPTSALQLATFPLLIAGAAHLAMKEGPHRLALLYAALLLLAVAAHPELQGPRHRIQILFLVSWCQFHGAYVLLAQRRQLGMMREAP